MTVRNQAVAHFLGYVGTAFYGETLDSRSEPRLYPDGDLILVHRDSDLGFIDWLGIVFVSK